MPTRTQAEAIRDLEIEFAVLNQRVATLAEAERVGNMADVKSQLAVLRHIVDDLLKRSEESERRRWQIVAAGISSVLALAVNLILLAVKR